MSISGDIAIWEVDVGPEFTAAPLRLPATRRLRTCETVRGRGSSPYRLVGRLLAMDDAALISELEPTVEVLLERHLAGAKEWFPHEYVPWSRGRDFVAGDAWDPREVRSRPGCPQARCS